LPARSFDRDKAVRDITEVERALREGYPPPGGTAHGSHQKNSLRVASDRIGDAPEALRRRVGTPEIPGSYWRNYALKVDWSLYAPPAQAPVIEPVPKVEKEPEAPADPIQSRRDKDEIARLKAALADAERKTAEAQDHAAALLDLTTEPLRPRLVIPSKNDPAVGGRTVILHLSDVHYGEVVSLEEMDGVNRYDATVSRVRLGRFFDKAASLMTDYWYGDAPDEIILCLGGDLISGNLHPELAETNDPAIPFTVREVGENIAGGLALLRERVKVPMRVYSVPGNHGRSTQKPQSKGRARSSWDLLATDFVEASLRGAGIRDVPFYRTQSTDAYFSTYGWHWLLTHGDTMGGRGGGTGFIGAMASIIKGHRKLVDTSWRSGRPVHFVLTAHYHTSCETPFGWGNGSVIGYSEFPRDNRMDPEGSRQNMLVVHPRHGVIARHPLYLGVESEGSHYAGPASIIRPVFDGEAA
jgi:hypothetical protein